MKAFIKKRAGQTLLAAGLIGLSGMVGSSQEHNASRRIVSLSNPSQPALVKANVGRGKIQVESYPGKDVVVELRSDGKAPLKVTEADNVVSINDGTPLRSADLWIQVPAAANLKLRNGDGEVRVAKVKGEFDLSSINGNILLAEVSGPVVAHTVNGRLKADFTAMAPDQAMAFAAVNGDIEITFPADLKAKVRLAAVHGKIACDFAVEQDRAARKAQAPGFQGKTVAGLVNGGGADIRVTTVNGSIRIKRR